MSDEQKSTAKPINSSYYHGRTTTKGEEAERFKPQLISESDNNTQSNTQTQGSKWNSAQTFESEEFSQQIIISSLEEIYSNYEILISEKNFIKLGKISKIDGYANRTFTRGKKVLTFELNNISFDLIDMNDEQLPEATLCFKEVDFASTDDFTIKVIGVSDVGITKAVRANEKNLRKLFGDFIKNILAKDVE
jgi:hypothetical protein